MGNLGTIKNKRSSEMRILLNIQERLQKQFAGFEARRVWTALTWLGNLFVMGGMGVDKITTLTGIPVSVIEEVIEERAEPEPPIIDKVATFIERFTFLRDKCLYRLIATWVVATHMYKEFEYFGYLFIHSPEWRSGKSRLLEVLDMLVFNSSTILNSPTESVLFRTADNSTQLLDEVDSMNNRDDLRSLLNAGFRNGNTVPRMRDTTKGKYEVEKFLVFAPRALAGIGTSILNGTTRDRSFMIQMVRQRKDERRESFRRRRLETEAKALKDQIRDWVKQYKEQIKSVYDRSDFPYLEDFQDRTIDVTEPLAAILEVTYKDHPLAKEANRDLIHAVAIAREDQESILSEHDILRELARLAENADSLVGNATELANMCEGLEDKPTPQEITRVLRLYYFKTKSIRKNGKPKYRYELHYKELQEILERYASPSEGVTSEDTDTERVEAVMEPVGNEDR